MRKEGTTETFNYCRENILCYPCAGLNRENTYCTAVTVPTNILVTVITAIPASALSLSGFEQNSVDDDNQNGMYSWTPATVWILRICEH